MTVRSARFEARGRERWRCHCCCHVSQYGSNAPPSRASARRCRSAGPPSTHTPTPAPHPTPPPPPPPPPAAPPAPPASGARGAPPPGAAPPRPPRQSPRRQWPVIPRRRGRIARRLISKTPASSPCHPGYASSSLSSVIGYPVPRSTSRSANVLLPAPLGPSMAITNPERPEMPATHDRTIDSAPATLIRVTTTPPETNPSELRPQSQRQRWPTRHRSARHPTTPPVMVAPMCVPCSFRTHELPSLWQACCRDELRARVAQTPC